LIGKLKSGQTILLEDGTKIEPEDVYADDSEDYRSNVLIVDCESVSKFESLTTSNILKVKIVLIFFVRIFRATQMELDNWDISSILQLIEF
jgi:hypothetical protein